MGYYLAEGPPDFYADSSCTSNPGNGLQKELSRKTSGNNWQPLNITLRKKKLSQEGTSIQPK
jgi:hypothetical protein